MKLIEPVGIQEIAERMGVTRSTVKQWRLRGLGFPEPRTTVGGRPCWHWNDVHEWAKATKRV